MALFKVVSPQCTLPEILAHLIATGCLCNVRSPKAWLRESSVRKASPSSLRVSPVVCYVRQSFISLLRSITANNNRPVEFNSDCLRPKPSLQEARDASTAGSSSGRRQKEKDGWHVVSHSPEEGNDSDSENSNESFVMLTEEDDGSLRLDRVL